MHDPKVVAFDIVRPWPRRAHYRDNRPNRPRWSFGLGHFWTVAGRGLYWPSLITVWHNEPGGRDSFEVCKHRGHWKWHIHHWSIQVLPLQAFRRWALTRCEWCSGRSRKGDPVNVSHQWHRERGPWWRGERGLYHQDCSSISTAHKVCVCGLGPWDKFLGGQPHGVCASCGKTRGWRKEHHPHGDEAQRLLATIPQGQRDPAKTAASRALWKQERD